MFGWPPNCACADMHRLKSNEAIPRREFVPRDPCRTNQALTVHAALAGVGIGYSRQLREGASKSEISGVLRREAAGRTRRRCSTPTSRELRRRATMISVVTEHLFCYVIRRNDYVIHRNGSMDNPFIYGEIVPDDAFADRETELDRLATDLGGGQGFLISPRRYGKSSLVYRVLSTLARRGLLP